MLLMPLIEQYPEVVFDVFHGGYPWIHEVGALSRNYLNVRLNLESPLEPAPVGRPRENL